MQSVKPVFFVFLLSLSFFLSTARAQQSEPRVYSAANRPVGTATSAGFLPSHPFPQHSSYQEGTILPNHISQEEMDDSVKSFYMAWKKHYILTGCREDEKYVWFEGTHGSNICVSEGQGYGMVIVALMAGFDTNAQATYDCLYRFYKSHPSMTSAHLMAWTQKKDCVSLDGGAATDGDMDIAYSLLLANAQWGRHSNIPYHQEALAMIDAIRHQEINPRTYVIMEDNTSKPRSKDYYDMRSSDYMPDHLRAFREATGDPFWDTVIANNYRVFRYLQDTYSPEAGLVPDFIKDIHVSRSHVVATTGQVATEGRKKDTSAVTGAGSRTADSLKSYSGSSASRTAASGTAAFPTAASRSAASPTAAPGFAGNSLAEGMDPDDANLVAQPVQPNYLESKYDGVYNFNACRVPWHIGTDFLVSGDPRAAAFLSRINKWIQETTKGNPDNISAGYSLGGNDLPHRYFEALCFICPFAVAAMSNPDNQEWLNNLWDYIQHFKMKNFDYYDNTIKMLTMIILSGNYWTPATPPGTFTASHSRQGASPEHQPLPGSDGADRASR